MQRHNQAFALILCLALPGMTRAEEPLSAIDWLSQTVATPAVMARPGAHGGIPRDEPPVSKGAGTRAITTSPIDGLNIDGLGILPAARIGLPQRLWGTSSTADLTRLIGNQNVDTVPALQSLLQSLMTAELAPPVDAQADGALFLARVDKLLDMGALDPALAMLELPDPPPPEVFRRWFDVALLLGQEDRACLQMARTPQVAPTFPARIFCLARGGDWNAAALSLRTGEALGQIDTDMAALLARFLDDELADGAAPLPTPARISPLILRVMEAIGQAQPTTTLPLAFAQADLRDNTGWKARLEAGERLARTGALDPNALLGLYTEQKPAASGGVWDRVRAVQDFDAALNGNDAGAVALVLPVVWDRLSGIELEVPFATLFGEKLAAMKLPPPAAAIAFRVGLLSPGYEAVARARKPADAAETFLIGVARGAPVAANPPDDLTATIAAGFDASAVLPDDQQARLKNDRLGEAILVAIGQVTDGVHGDLRNLGAGLTLLRRVGLESTARRAALQLLLLERRG